MKDIVQMLLDFSAVSWDRGFAIVIIISILAGAAVKIMSQIRRIFSDYNKYRLKNKN